MVAVTAEATGHLSRTDADETQKALQDLLNKQAREQTGNTAGPLFRGKPLLLDVALKLWCEDRRSLEWLTTAVKGIKLPSDVKLTVK